MTKYSSTNCLNIKGLGLNGYNKYLNDCSSTPSPSLKRCNECRQYLDDELVTVNPIKGASPEYITLTNPDLNIYEEDSSAMTDERVQHKITGFRWVNPV